MARLFGIQKTPRFVSQRKVSHDRVHVYVYVCERTRMYIVRHVHEYIQSRTGDTNAVVSIIRECWKTPFLLVASVSPSPLRENACHPCGNSRSKGIGAKGFGTFDGFRAILDTRWW